MKRGFDGFSAADHSLRLRRGSGGTVLWGAGVRFLVDGAAKSSRRRTCETTNLILVARTRQAGERIGVTG